MKSIECSQKCLFFFLGFIIGTTNLKDRDGDL